MLIPRGRRSAEGFWSFLWSGRRVAVAALVLIAFLRLALVAFHSPMLGWADNSDFLRIQGWFGLDSGVDQASVAPIRYYSRGPSNEDNRYITVLVPLVGAADWLSGPAHFDLRVLGILQLGVAALTIVAVVRLSEPGVRIMAGAVAALVLADPAHALFMNSMYAEWLAIVAWYATIFLLARAASIDRAEWTVFVAAAISLALLGCTKKQFMALPLLMTGTVVLCSQLKRRRNWARAALLISASLIPVAVYSGKLFPVSAYMRMAQHSNAVNTCLGLLLPNMRNPAAGLDLLGLPASYASVVGLGWNDINLHEFPELNNVPTTGFIRLLAHEPALLLAASREAFPRVRPSILQFAQVEGAHMERVTTSGPSIFFSSFELLDRMPFWAFAAAHCFVGVLLVAAVVLSSRFASTGTVTEAIPRSLSLISLLLVGSWFYSFYSSAFGDGLFEFSKHAFICGASLLAAAVACGTGISSLFFARKNRAPLSAYHE